MQAASSLLFVESIKSLRPRIDAALNSRMTLAGDGCPARLREAMRYSLLAPGKRLRPVLVLLAAEACGSDDIQAAMPAACAVEMIHAYSLIHDDLPAMDDDDLRRGRPTCHKAYNEPTAILAGDALLTLAFEVLAREVQPPKVAAACCAALAHAAGACNMVGGQMDDVASDGGRGNGGEALAALESIHNRKTGAMIQVSLRLGAIIAGGSEEQLAALDSFGRRIGLAFQIKDDLLDVLSSEAETGKRVGKDAERGKMTFPGILGLDQSTQYAQQLIGEACRDIECFGPRGDALCSLANYVLERNR